MRVVLVCIGALILTLYAGLTPSESRRHVPERVELMPAIHHAPVDAAPPKRPVRAMQRVPARPPARPASQSGMTPAEYLAKRQRYGTQSRPLSATDPLLLDAPQLKRATVPQTGAMVFSQPETTQVQAGRPLRVTSWAEGESTPLTAYLVARRNGRTVVLSTAAGIAHSGETLDFALDTSQVRADDRLSLRVRSDAPEGEDSARMQHRITPQANTVTLAGPLTDSVHAGHLRITVPVEAAEPRMVHVAATLVTPAGQLVAYTERRAGVAAGVSNIELVIAGPVLCDANVDGPLIVRHVRLSDVTDGVISAPLAPVQHQTETYPARTWSC